MKMSDKFKNLGQSGLARRIAPKEADDRRQHAKPRSAAASITSTVTGPTPATVVEAPVVTPKKADRVKRWREANPELYLARQRVYQARSKAKKLAEKAKK